MVSSAWATRWSADQITLITGADQLRVFDDKYYVLFFALLVVWGLMLVELIRQRGAPRIASALPLQLCVLSAAGVFLLPGSDLDSRLPARSGVYRRAHVAGRGSLHLRAAGVRASARALQQWAMAAVAVVFFGFLFHDESALNAFEGRMQQMVMRSAAGTARGERRRRPLAARQCDGAHDRPRLHRPLL